MPIAYELNNDPRMPDDKRAGLVRALNEIRELVDGYIDIIDGDHGPLPNLAMRVDDIARQALAAAGGEDQAPAHYSCTVANCQLCAHTTAAAPPTTTAPGEELPGMLAVARGVHLHEWPHTMDARVWADHWIEITRDKARADFMDHGWMTSWFANAIMAGYDTANQLASAARAASCEQDKRRLDYLEGEAICDHPRALFRRNVPITREAIDADMAAPLRLSALASAGQGKERG